MAQNWLVERIEGVIRKDSTITDENILGVFLHALTDEEFGQLIKSSDALDVSVTCSAILSHYKESK